MQLGGAGALPSAQRSRQWRAARCCERSPLKGGHPMNTVSRPARWLTIAMTSPRILEKQPVYCKVSSFGGHNKAFAKGVVSTTIVGHWRSPLTGLLMKSAFYSLQTSRAHAPAYSISSKE